MSTISDTLVSAATYRVEMGATQSGSTWGA